VDRKGARRLHSRDVEPRDACGTPNPEFQLTGGWEAVRTLARSGETFQPGPPGVAKRVTVVGQSFFDPLPAGADLYLLKNALNDWPDREVRAIVSRCSEAARPTRRVVVLGGVRPDDAPRAW
jgi:O-methyltransferase domain